MRDGILEDGILGQVRATHNLSQLAEIVKVAQRQMEKVALVNHRARIQEQLGSDLERYRQLRGDLGEVQQRLVAGIKEYADENQVAASFDPNTEGYIVIGAVSDNDKVGKRRSPVNYATIAQGLPDNVDNLRLRLEIDSHTVDAVMLRSGKVSADREYSDPPAWRRAAYEAASKASPKGNPLNDIKVCHDGEWVTFSSFKNAILKGEMVATSPTDEFQAEACQSLSAEARDDEDNTEPLILAA